MGLAEGSRLGPYRVGPLVGAGGMGEVYRARDERLGRDVAIKVVASVDAVDAEMLRRFDQEARAASALNHPGILTVYDVGVHEGLPYVVCELLEGQTLRERLREGTLPQRRAVELAVQVAQALAAAHEKGIVHRDLKPENVFVLRDGRAKILDFGLAKLVRRDVPGQDATGSIQPEEPGTRPGTVMGTVGYMSPEQVRGQPTDHRSDIFAFGTVLYEMLAGRRAFQGSSAVETMSAILKEDPPGLPAEAHLGPATERLLHRCLEKAPERRFQSASDLAFALEALSGTTHSTPAAVAPPPARGRRAALVGLGALGAAGLVGSGWALRDRLAVRSEPVFQRLTFRRGLIIDARFAADGQTVVYAASWDGGAAQVYVVRRDSPESAAVAIPPARLYAVSARGELAIGITSPDLRRTLARVPLAGGTPREVLADVVAADWSPDGSELAVVRRVDGKVRLEYPIGKVLLESPAPVVAIRVSPDGRRVAYLMFGPTSSLMVVAVVDRDGASRELARLPRTETGLTWRNGDEIWLASPHAERPPDVRGVSLSGEQRLVLGGAPAMFVYDVARDGSALVTDATWRAEMLFRGPSDAEERDLAWLDWSVARGLSADGSLLLFDETRVGGRRGSVYLRRTDGSPPVRLADGLALDLSPDGTTALVHADGTSPELRIVPTGAGEVVTLPQGPLTAVTLARFVPGGRSVLIGGRTSDGRRQLFMQDIVARTPPVFLGDSPGGIGVPGPPDVGVAIALPGGAALMPAGGGPVVPIPGSVPGDVPLWLDGEGRRLLVGAASLFPERLWLIDRQTGRRSEWKQLAPRDRSGTTSAQSLVFSADLGSYCYTVGRHLVTLHVVQGLV